MLDVTAGFGSFFFNLSSDLDNNRWLIVDSLLLDIIFISV